MEDVRKYEDGLGVEHAVPIYRTRPNESANDLCRKAGLEIVPRSKRADAQKMGKIDGFVDDGALSWPVIRRGR